MNKNIESNHYYQHLYSEKWKQLRSTKLFLAGYKCERCGSAKVALDLHHKTYERFGNEKPEDVVLLCRKCHLIADQMRKDQAANNRGANSWYSAALNTYATKKYGEDWFYEQDEADLQEEFDDWLERKNAD